MTDSLSTLTVADLLDRLGSRAPTPGGGSASALAGATAAALVGMVLELTAGRTDAGEPASIVDQLATANGLRAELTELIDLDAAAYDGVVAARRLPRDTDDEIAARRQAVARASSDAAGVPLRIATTASEVLELAEDVAAFGTKTAISDIGVAAELAAAAVRGAALNVDINLPYLADDDPLATRARTELDRLRADLMDREGRIRTAVMERMA